MKSEVNSRWWDVVVCLFIPLGAMFGSATIAAWLTLFGAHPYWPVLLALWVLLGAMVYFIGHRIEAMMVERAAVPPAPSLESQSGGADV